MPSFTLRSSDLCRLAGFWGLVRLKVENLSTRCCIVGAGPCGLMLGLLLARAGVDVRTSRGVTRAMLFPKGIMGAKWEADAADARGVVASVSDGGP